MMRHWKSFSVVFLLLAAGFAPHQGRQPVKWALIVGVGDYLNYERERGGDLVGAKNDARAMHEVLTARWGFAEENVRLLLDLDATRDAIEESFTGWLPSVVQPGDLVLFYFSGHGSQVWDQDGDEPDGLDETICPTDVLRGSSRKDIRDDEVSGWLDALPTENITVILDSCHSGTATRAAPFVRTRSLDREPESDLAAERPEIETRSAITAAEVASFGGGVLEIASAQSDQYAVETVFDGIEGRLPRAGGAFTTPFVHHLWQVPLSTTYEEVFEMTVQSMKQRNFSQNPRLGEVADRVGREVFALPGSAAAPVAAGPSAEDAAPEPLPEGALPVVAWEDQRVELGGGSSAGVTVGSLYSARGEILRITEVESGRAVAERVSEGTRGVTVSARNATSTTAADAAILLAHQNPGATLRVTIAELPAALRTTLEASLSSTPGIVLQPDANAIAELMIQPEGAEYQVLGVDGSVRHAVSASQGAAETLAGILQKELSAMTVARLENPVRPFRVDFSFGGPDNTFRVGDPAVFEITSSRDGYLTVVDVDQVGSVNLIFPNQWMTDNAIRAGQRITIPSPEMGFDFLMSEPIGRGIVRVFVTERPLELPAGGAGLTADQIAEALRKASGPPLIPGSTAVPVDTWATASVVYDIKP